MSTKIIAFPEQQELKKDTERLRTELSMLMLEYDTLFIVECRNIAVMYVLAVGALEYKEYEAECMYLRLKRKAELIQTKINRQERVDPDLIEFFLDQEFIEHQKKLREKMEEMNSAITLNKSDRLSYDDTKELKQRYRRIVKVIHPDIHPDLDDTQVDLFYNAAEAYAFGDLETIRIIDQMVSEPLSDQSIESAVKLKHDKERLIELIQITKDRIIKRKSEYPYTVKDILTDPEKLAQRKEQINESIRRYEEMIAAYNEHIKEMLR